MKVSRRCAAVLPATTMSTFVPASLCQGSEYFGTSFRRLHEAEVCREYKFPSYILNFTSLRSSWWGGRVWSGLKFCFVHLLSQSGMAHDILFEPFIWHCSWRSKVQRWEVVLAVTQFFSACNAFFLIKMNPTPSTLCWTNNGNECIHIFAQVIY